MIKTTTIVITALLAVMLIYLFPKRTISPGDLTRGHVNMENDCMKCHTMFFGTPGQKCVICHKPAEVGILTTAGVKIGYKARKVRTAFHRIFAEDSCVSCHKDHSGQYMKKTAGKFSHSLFQGKNMDRCMTCHKSPDDTMHRGNRQECSRCHTTDRWRPATLDHARFFRFDRQHGLDCLTCHRDNNYREYTCYGCHDHSPGKIRKEHLEEGIRNYQDCAACHRSSKEDEAKRVLRSGAHQYRSWNGPGSGGIFRNEAYREPVYNYYNRGEDDDDDDEDHDRRAKHHDD